MNALFAQAGKSASDAMGGRAGVGGLTMVSCRPMDRKAVCGGVLLIGGYGYRCRNIMLISHHTYDIIMSNASMDALQT